LRVHCCAFAWQVLRLRRPPPKAEVGGVRAGPQGSGALARSRGMCMAVRLIPGKCERACACMCAHVCVCVCMCVHRCVCVFGGGERAGGLVCLHECNWVQWLAEFAQGVGSAQTEILAFRA